MAFGLSKSRILAGLQCEKRLWLQTHRRDLVHYDDSTQARFAEGHRVGELAQALFPDGVLMPDDLGDAIKETQEVLGTGRPIFEATFDYDGVLVRVDVLEPDGDGYILNEVKSSTSVKDTYIPDCAVQTWVLQQRGLTITRTNLMHIDNSFIYPGDGDYRGLLYPADVSECIADDLLEVPEWVTRFQSMLAEGCPEIEVGNHCHTPYDCPFLDHCKPPGPEYPVTLLSGGGKSVQALLDAGYEDLASVPAGVIEKPLHERQRAATVSGEAYLDTGAADVIRGLGFPRYYLDFETIGGAIPIWAGTSPYKPIPFQWSIHIEHEDGQVEHHKCLVTHGRDPREEVTEALVEALGQAGPIFSYSAYEKRCLGILKKAVPALETEIDSAIERLVDLLPITRKHYYHRDMKGSYSIKYVTPTVAPDLSYADLEDVQDGGGAESAFMEVIHADTDGDRCESLRAALLTYCGLDTEAMVRLVHVLLHEPEN
jgi:uncharacterized protein DUF2779